LGAGFVPSICCEVKACQTAISPSPSTPFDFADSNAFPTEILTFLVCVSTSSFNVSMVLFRVACSLRRLVSVRRLGRYVRFHALSCLALHALTREEKVAAEVDHGLMVEDVAGPAARAGIQPGDVVLGINGQPAHSVEQVRGIVGAHPKSLALLIDRNGQKIFVPVKLG